MDAFLFHSTSRSLYLEVMADLATLDSETFFTSKMFGLISTLFSSVPTTTFLRKKVAKSKKEVAISRSYGRFCNLGLRDFFMSKKFSLKSTHFSAIPMTIFRRKKVAKSKVAKSYNGYSDLEKERKRKASIPKCF